MRAPDMLRQLLMLVCEKRELSPLFLFFSLSLSQFQPDGVPQGDCASVDIDLAYVHTHDVCVCEHDHGEGLVDLPQVNILCGEPCSLERPLNRNGRRSGKVNGRLGAVREGCVMGV